MFRSLLVFWLTVADPFLVTLIGASLWELFDLTIVYKSISHGAEELTGLDVVSAACLLQSSSGKLVGIFHENAYLFKRSSNILQDEWKCSRHELLTNPPV